MDKDIAKKLENHTFSQEYEFCLSKAEELSLFEQFSLANKLMENFNDWLKLNKKSNT